MNTLARSKTIARSALVVLALGLAGCAGVDGGSTSARGGDPFDAGMDAPPNPQTLFRLARILAAQGRDDEARHVLQDVIQRYPTFAPAYCDLAELHMRAGRTDEAADVLERGLASCPRDARLTGNLGMCYMVKGDYARALTQFQQASAMGSDDARHRSNMAVALGMLGRYDESLAEYQKVVSPAAAHYNVSVLAKARQDSQRADLERQMATQLDPSVAQVSVAPATDHESR